MAKVIVKVTRGSKEEIAKILKERIPQMTGQRVKVIIK
jgi:hypothetical protein